MGEGLKTKDMNTEKELNKMKKTLGLYKWQWMIKYCKEKRIPAAQKWAWDEAKEEFWKVHYK